LGVKEDLPIKTELRIDFEEIYFRINQLVLEQEGYYHIAFSDEVVGMFYSIELDFRKLLWAG